MIEEDNKLRTWESLSPDEQVRLQVEYGHYLDSLPPTCSLETKIERFRHWLKTAKAIEYR